VISTESQSHLVTRIKPNAQEVRAKTQDDHIKNIYVMFDTQMRDYSTAHEICAIGSERADMKSLI